MSYLGLIRQGRKTASFSRFLLLSFSFHLLLLAYMVLIPFFSPYGRQRPESENVGILNQAIGEMEEGGIDPGVVEQLLGGIELDPALNKKARMEVYKKLIGSLQKLRGESGLSDSQADLSLSDILDLFDESGEGELDSGNKIFPFIPETDEWGAELHSLTKKRRETLDFLRRFEDQEKDRTQMARGQVKVETESGIKYIPTEYYFRDSPYEEILAQGASLFYIIRGFPGLDLFSTAENSQNPDKENPGQFHAQDARVIYVTDLTRPDSGIEEFTDKNREFFEFEGEKGKQIKSIVDSLMALSEVDQFVYFTERYLDVYDPDSQDLAELTHEFIHNNLSNVIIVIDPISTALPA